MTNPEARINFDALATLRKWPSVKKERVTTSLYVGPYLVLDGTLDECIREFLAKLSVSIICTRDSLRSYAPKERATEMISAETG
jgi:hypothetical protein